MSRLFCASYHPMFIAKREVFYTKVTHRPRRQPSPALRYQRPAGCLPVFEDASGPGRPMLYHLQDRMVTFPSEAGHQVSRYDICSGWLLDL